MITGPLASKVPANIGNTAFFEPDTRTWPDKGIPPLIISLFMDELLSLTEAFKKAAILADACKECRA